MSTNRECEWSATSEAAWVALAGAEGQGAGSIQFTVASNADPASRNARITVNDQQLQIAQQGRPCEFSVSSTRETIDSTGGDRTIGVRASAQCGWTAAATVPWITILSGREGRGEGAVSFHVAPVSGPPRTGTLNVAGQTVQVEQGTGCTYSIGTDAFTVDAAGADRQVTVSASPGCAWTAQSNNAWITITSGSTGTGPGTTAFRVAASGGPSRTGTLNVAGKIVTVVQSPDCRVSVSPANLNESARGGSATIHVDTAAGCPWTAETNVPWLTLSGAANGSGSAQVQVAVAANTGPARSGSVIIAGQRVAVAQASGCTYAVSPAGQQIPASGGTAAGTVATGAGCTWTAASGVDWITIATPSGSGPGQATFSVAPNQGPRRTGTLTIAGQTHTVNQASPCTWLFLPPSHELDASGGQGNVLVLVSGACTWTATSTVDWIRITAGASGVGGGLLQFTVAPNLGSARSGVIVVAGENYQVRQAGR